MQQGAHPVFNFLPRRKSFEYPCRCCGAKSFTHQDVLWKELVNAWELNEVEVAYINRQQGFHCTKCNNNLRSQALATALLKHCNFPGPLKDLGSQCAIRLLEINKAGNLTSFLSNIAGHRLVEYPSVDMTDLPIANESYELVVHSDTLEHVPDPGKGLRECARVLVNGGACIFTVPIVIGRLSRDCSNRPPSYHGSANNPEDCRVVTEFGADVWTLPIQNGFAECRLVALEFPAAVAIVAIK
jgi:SAM-dependent methyltransferase